MSDGILKDVLQLEKQIEIDLAREQDRAEAWFTRSCQLVDAEMSCTREDDTHSTELQSLDAVRTARNAAAAELRRERRRAKDLAGLADEALLPLLDQQLKEVLTGRDHDCPDDQG